jgi:predicted TIM-barrel fold metal-dependent hydrolase
MSENPTNPTAGMLSVSDFRPKSMLRLKTTIITQAKYPCIDAHNHYSDKMEPSWLIDSMDVCNVKVFVDLSGFYGDRLKRRLERLKGQYPTRFAVFHVPDFGNISAPGFDVKAARELEEAVRAGAQGLKIFKSLGLSVRDAQGQLVRLTDPRLAPLWQTAGELGVPVMIHVADPFAFFTSLDAENERYYELQLHPDWHFYGDDYPPLQQLFEDRDALLEQFPGTNWIGAHIGSQSEDLDRASYLLDRFPNYYVDFSAREAEIGRQPRRAYQFFLRYQDRIVFGIDSWPDRAMYRSYFRTLETDDEYYRYGGWPLQGLWCISGLHLPDAVLQKVYYQNALRLIPGVQI